jgi:hypothetical protein
MMNTLATLGAVQTQRLRALPAKVLDNLVRTAALNWLQQRNAALDALFYDVGAVTAKETPEVAFWLAREGATFVVPPTGKGELRVFLTPDDLFREGSGVAALAMAGVGSSALGAAAFARNVADALEEPVAAVVSGYGLADVVTEAIGGYFDGRADRQTRGRMAAKPPVREPSRHFGLLALAAMARSHPSLTRA